MFCELYHVTAAVLDLLYKQYTLQKISLDTFETHSDNKIRFLDENIATIHSEEEMKEVSELLRDCRSILSADTFALSS